jgi:hypothetical protein
MSSSESSVYGQISTVVSQLDQTRALASSRTLRHAGHVARRALATQLGGEEELRSSSSSSAAVVGGVNSPAGVAASDGEQALPPRAADDAESSPDEPGSGQPALGINSHDGRTDDDEESPQTLVDIWSELNSGQPLPLWPAFAMLVLFYFLSEHAAGIGEVLALLVLVFTCEQVVEARMTAAWATPDGASSAGLSWRVVTVVLVVAMALGYIWAHRHDPGREFLRFLTLQRPVHPACELPPGVVHDGGGTSTPSNSSSSSSSSIVGWLLPDAWLLTAAGRSAHSAAVQEYFADGMLGCQGLGCPTTKEGVEILAAECLERQRQLKSSDLGSTVFTVLVVDMVAKSVVIWFAACVLCSLGILHRCNQLRRRRQRQERSLSLLPLRGDAGSGTGSEGAQGSLTISDAGALLPDSGAAHQRQCGRPAAGVPSCRSLLQLLTSLSTAYRCLLPIGPWLWFFNGYDDMQWSCVGDVPSVSVCQWTSRSGKAVIAHLATAAFVLIKLRLLRQQWQGVSVAYRDVCRRDGPVHGKAVSMATLLALEEDGDRFACSVCTEHFVAQRRRGFLVVKLHCGHMFCDGCIEEWLRREHTCPLCRAPISTALQGAAKRSAPPFVFCF